MSLYKKQQSGITAQLEWKHVLGFHFDVVETSSFISIRMFSLFCQQGVPWGNAAISNAIWRGPRLRDVLMAAGVDKVKFQFNSV